MPKKKLFFDNGGFYLKKDFAKLQRDINDNSPNEEPDRKVEKSKTSSIDNESDVPELKSVKEDHVKEKKKKHKNESCKDDEIYVVHLNTIEESVKKKKKHKNKSASKECDDEGVAFQHITNAESFDQTPSKKKKKHKYNLSPKGGEDVVVQHSIIEEPVKEEHIAMNVIKLEAVDEELMKGKKKRHENKSVIIGDEDIEMEHNTNVKSEEAQVIEKKKKHKCKSTSLERKDESIPVRHVINMESDEVPLKKKKKRHKYNLSPKSEEDVVQCMLIDESVEQHIKNRNIIDNHVVHDIKVEAVDQGPMTEKKKRHRKRSMNAGEGIEMVNNTNVESEKVEQLIEKKNHKHKSTCLEGKDERTTVQYVINMESDEEPLKKKKKSHKYNLSSKSGEDVVVQHSIIEESVEEHIKKRNIVDNHVIKVEAVDQEPMKEKKKRHANQSMKEYEDIKMENNANVESENVQVIEKKKKHKHNSTCLEGKDEITAVRHVINMDSDEVPLKKKKKSHKYYLSPEGGEDVVMQDSIIEESVEEHIKNRSVIDNLTVHVIEEEAVDQEPMKENKKRHKNTSINEDKVSDRGEGIEMENNTNEEFKEVQVIEKKKHKHKSTCLEIKDERTTVQHVINVESNEDEHLLKKKKRSHNSKLSSRDVEDASLVVQHNITEESVKEQLEENNKNQHHHKNSDKDKSESSNSMLYSSDEELFDVGSSVQFVIPNLDFGEEPVEFEVPLLHSCENVQQIGEEEREALKSRGVTFKLGKFSEIENSLLKRNFENFGRRFGVNDPQVLLGLGQQYRNNEIAKFLKAKHFYVRLGKDLNDRPLYNIYKKARLLFDTKHKKLSPTKVVHLKKAHSHLGNRWQEIGNKINRSGNTTRSAYLWHDKPVKLGNWTVAEEDELVKAIRTVLGVTDLYNTELAGISWEEVANLVPRRNFHQCRLHWFENLSRKFKEVVWHKKNYSKLVSILNRECYVEDYTQIDWKEVEKCFGGPGWQFLRKKWYALKKRLPTKNMTYKQMLKYFYALYKRDIENSEIEVA